MTVMGLDYLKYSEAKRANLAKEAETHRNNVQNENLNYAQYLESVRSHKADESIQSASLDEKIRTDKANELISQGKLNEQVRADVANEYLKQQDTMLRNATPIMKGVYANTVLSNTDAYKTQSPPLEVGIGTILDTVLDRVSGGLGTVLKAVAK